jgi:hypothetical protein
LYRSIEGHFSAPGETSPCPGCVYGGCFGAAMVGLHKLNAFDPQLERRLLSTLEPIK